MDRCFGGGASIWRERSNDQGERLATLSHFTRNYLKNIGIIILLYPCFTSKIGLAHGPHYSVYSRTKCIMPSNGLRGRGGLQYRRSLARCRGAGASERVHSGPSCKHHSEPYYFPFTARPKNHRSCRDRSRNPRQKSHGPRYVALRRG